MVKRILLISLFLFMPFISRADTIVIGNDINENNIPLDIHKMRTSIKKVFAPLNSSYADTVTANLFEVLYGSGMNAPFSMAQLYGACIEATFNRLQLDRDKSSSGCMKFMDVYIDSVKHARKYPTRIIL